MWYALPVASFTADPPLGQAPLAVNFTDTSTGNPDSWLWNFGDGTTSIVRNPPMHIFTAPGEYTVRLQVENLAGTSPVFYRVITVLPSPPVANFVGVPNPVRKNYQVQFTDLSSNTPTTWLWNFGDGTTSAARNPTHAYNQKGTYTVSLTVNNTAGSDMEIKTNYMTVTNT